MPALFKHVASLVFNPPSCTPPQLCSPAQASPQYVSCCATARPSATPQALGCPPGKMSCHPATNAFALVTQRSSVGVAPKSLRPTIDPSGSPAASERTRPLPVVRNFGG